MKKEMEIVTASEEDQLKTKQCMENIMRENYRNAYKVIIATTSAYGPEDYTYIESTLASILLGSEESSAFPIKIITGLEQGNEAPALKYALSHGIPAISFHPNPEDGPFMDIKCRAEEMADYATHAILFADESDCTDHFINAIRITAKGKGIPVWICGKMPEIKPKLYDE